MPFTDMKFPVPENVAITILIKVFYCKGISICACKVGYKCKPRKKASRVSLSRKEFPHRPVLMGFPEEFIQTYPDIPIVELDTVEGGRITVRRLSLTIFFVTALLCSIFVLQEKSQEQVIKVFDYLTQQLGIKVFQELFPVILTDNGVEFQFPGRLECDKNGEIRYPEYFTAIQTPPGKRPHRRSREYIRYVIPKGQSLDSYKQRDACILHESHQQRSKRQPERLHSIQAV